MLWDVHYCNLFIKEEMETLNNLLKAMWLGSNGAGILKSQILKFIFLPKTIWYIFCFSWFELNNKWLMSKWIGFTKWIGRVWKLLQDALVHGVRRGWGTITLRCGAQPCAVCLRCTLRLNETMSLLRFLFLSWVEVFAQDMSPPVVQHFLFHSPSAVSILLPNRAELAGWNVSQHTSQAFLLHMLPSALSLWSPLCQLAVSSGLRVHDL